MRGARLHTCRFCGCDDKRACPGGCAWVALDIEQPTGICSACVEEIVAEQGWDFFFLSGELVEPDPATLTAERPHLRLVLP